MYLKSLVNQFHVAPNEELKYDRWQLAQTGCVSMIIFVILNNILRFIVATLVANSRK